MYISSIFLNVPRIYKCNYFLFYWISVLGLMCIWCMKPRLENFTIWSQDLCINSNSLFKSRFLNNISLLFHHLIWWDRWWAFISINGRGIPLFNIPLKLGVSEWTSNLFSMRQWENPVRGLVTKSVIWSFDGRNNKEIRTYRNSFLTK